MRTFIAIDLTGEIKTKLNTVTTNLKKLPLKVKWVEPENLHITLKFLSNIDQNQLAKIKEIIANIACRYNSFSVELANFGFFPNFKKPRIFFISFSSGQILEKIAEDLSQKLNLLGFKKNKKIKSHITLARIKSLKNIKQLTTEIDQLKIEGKIKIDRITIFKSTLTRKGPIYEKIGKANLKD